jgi:DNA mismatch repair ATPase MutS
MEKKVSKIKRLIRAMIREELERYRAEILREVASMILLSEERIKRGNNGNSDFGKSMNNLRKMPAYKKIVESVVDPNDIPKVGNASIFDVLNETDPLDDDTYSEIEKELSVEDILKQTDPLDESEVNGSDPLVDAFIKMGVKERFDTISQKADELRKGFLT